MATGKHLLIDCVGVDPKLCLDDGLVLDVMSQAAKKAGANVISQVRYRFGHDSPPGFTAVVLLDESHCSAHCYAESREMAIDIFTCGATDPMEVWRYIAAELDLGEVSLREVPRFHQTSVANSHQ